MTSESQTSIDQLLRRAIAARASRFDTRHESALRLFNGFYEGCPSLAIDLYATTAVIHNYADPDSAGEPLVAAALEVLAEQLPWVRTIMVKTRNSPLLDQRNGVIVKGDTLTRKIKEHGVWYAVDLQLNRDAGFYLDTSELRRWLQQHMEGKTVLNTFAYTGSLGIAAMSGKATAVTQLDLSRNFLNQAKTSCSLNGFPIDKKQFIAGDFWAIAGRLRKAGNLFDCVILDPPFFAAGNRGTVDQENNCAALINKVRPLVKDGGYLITVNNALFLSGAEYYATLQHLTQDGYLEIVELIPVPQDFTGYPETIVGRPVTDPAPFNHSTKIAVLKIARKDHHA